MANGKLTVTPRTVLGKNVAKLRRAGITPANVYGHGLASASVQTDTVELTHLLRASTKNAIIDLSIEGEGAARSVVVRDIHRDPVTSRILHIEFYQVDLTQRMRAEVPVVLVGTSPAVETYAGVLLQTLELIAVEALPADIPTEFAFDVSVMTELEQSVHVRDLAIDSDKVTLHTDPDVVVARVASPRVATEEVPEAAAEGEEGAAAPTEESAEATPTPAE